MRTGSATYVLLLLLVSKRQFSPGAASGSPVVLEDGPIFCDAVKQMLFLKCSR